MNLLVVEASAQQQSTIAAQLRALGHAVDVASDGVQALACVANRDYDVIILDLELPKESSLLVLHEIRESNHEVEILILAAQDQIHDRITALIQGADDYLVKPFSAAQLQRRIRQLRSRGDAANAHHAGARRQLEKPDHLNRLIANLLSHCRCGPGEIELVISEIRPAQLLQRVSDELRQKIAGKNLRLRVPKLRQPVMLVDARWMQRLLVILVDNAIELSPPGGDIDIDLHPQRDYCHISIENSLLPATGDSSEPGRPRQCRDPTGTLTGRILDSLALANRHAGYLNLELQAGFSGAGRWRTRVDKIKIV